MNCSRCQEKMDLLFVAYSCRYCEGGVPRKATASSKIRLKRSGPMERWRVGWGYDNTALAAAAAKHGLPTVDWSPWNRVSAFLMKWGYADKIFSLESDACHDSYRAVVEERGGITVVEVAGSDLPQMSAIEIEGGDNE